jgi:hypothetical protein
VSTVKPTDIDPQEVQAEPVAPPEAPPAGEDIHLPPGSILPLTTAVGITMTIVGTTIGRIWLVLGFIIFVVSVGLWIRDVRRDIDHLPDEHHH